MTKLGFRTFSLLVLVTCFMVSNAEADDGLKTSQDNTKDIRQHVALAPSRQLRATPSETSEAQALALQDHFDKSKHRRLFLITSLISKLFDMEEEENSSAASGSSNNSSNSATFGSNRTPTPLLPAIPSSVPAPRPSPTTNTTVKGTPKPQQDPLSVISW